MTKHIIEPTANPEVESVKIEANAVMAGEDFYRNLASIRLSDGAIVRNSDNKVLGYIKGESLDNLSPPIKEHITDV